MPNNSSRSRKPRKNSAARTRRTTAAPSDSLPLIAIAGRPNVGKSTLFNRLTRTRRAMVGDEPGITRDRLYGDVRWAGREARLVDTGGIVPSDTELIPGEIFRQARTAFDTAAVIVMVVDGRAELAAPDLELAQFLRRLGKPVVLAINKMEAGFRDAAPDEYRRLGFSTIQPISAEHGTGIGELLDTVFGLLGPEPEESEEEAAAANEDEEETAAETKPEREIRVAIIGRPNVGKSTLLNALTGTGRAIVSPIAGTTRDAVDERVVRGGHAFRFIDTAGIRRKGKTEAMAEKLSVVMARKHLEAADVSLLVIDASAGVVASDATIGGYAHESGRSVIIVVNKWDLVTEARTDGKPPADKKVFEQQVRRALKFLDYAPVVFVSAASNRNVGQVFATVVRVSAEREKRVTTGQMNRFLARVDFERAPVPMAKRVRILYMTQASVAPPTFVLFTDRNVKLHFSYERFLENQVRAAFGFEGSPIYFKVRPRKPER